MAEEEKRIAFGRRGQRESQEQREERQELAESLIWTRALIHQAYLGFNSTADADLIESYIYEINSLQARYSYLLRRMKGLDENGADEEEEQMLLETAEPL